MKQTSLKVSKVYCYLIIRNA